MSRVCLACVIVLVAGSAAAQSRGSAPSRWTLVRSQTLTVIGDQSPRTVRRVADEIEQFRAVVGQLIGTARPPALPTIVYVFGNPRAMEPYAPPAERRAPMAGFYLRDTDLQRLVLSLDQPGDSPIAYHEYVHLILDNAIRGLPAWLSEGLAEYFSSYRLMVGGRIAEAGGDRPVYQALLRDGYLPIDSLLTQQASGSAAEGERLTSFYAHAWALTHYILNEVPRGGSAINRYVIQLRAGRPQVDAFRNAFGSSPSEFDGKLRQYIRRDIFPVRRFPLAEAVEVKPATVLRDLTVAEADAWLGDLLRVVRGHAAAAPSIESAAAAAPEAATVQFALGRLRFAQNQYAEGLAALARAAALAPDDFLIQLAYGGWLLRRGVSAGRAQAVVDETALAALTRAAMLDPLSPEPHARLATIQARSGATLEDARASLRRAIELAPGRLEYSVRLADLYLRVGALPPAKAILTAVLAGTSDRSLARTVTERLALIAERERMAARSVDTVP
jgi:tetratricopeptide (TPR) repeat protein